MASNCSSDTLWVRFRGCQFQRTRLMAWYCLCISRSVPCSFNSPIRPAQRKAKATPLASTAVNVFPNATFTIKNPKTRNIHQRKNKQPSPREAHRADTFKNQRNVYSLRGYASHERMGARARNPISNHYITSVNFNSTPRPYRSLCPGPPISWPIPISTRCTDQVCVCVEN